MNRREFTKRMVAASVAPALPLPALGSTAQTAALAKDPMYIWANFISRVHTNSSPAMIARHLKLDPEHGAKLYAQLVADGALTAPNAFGLSQSTNPLYPEFTRVTGHGQKIIKGLDKTRAKETFEDALADADISEDQDAPARAPLDEAGIEASQDPAEPESDENFTSP